jgi:CHAT domain-containing protein
VRAILIAFLFLAACANPRMGSPDALFVKSEKLLRVGAVREALAAADAGLVKEKSWRFRLQKAKALLSLQPRQALDLLNDGDGAATPEQRARREMYRGMAHFYLADFPAARAGFEYAAAISAPLKLPLLEAEIEIDRGTLAAQQGDAETARKFFQSALRAAADHDDDSLEARAMVSLGVLLQFNHQPDQAIYWLEQGRDLSGGAGLTSLEANALGNLGSSYLRLGDYDRAAKSLLNAERLFAKMGNRQQQQYWTGNLGNVLYENGDYRGAARKYQEAYSIAQSLGDKSWAGCWANDLALASINLNEFDAAEHFNREALQLGSNLPNCGFFYPRVNEAHIAAGRKNFAEAEKLYRAILANPSDDPVPLLQAKAGLTNVLVKTGQISQADAQFRSGIDFVERRRAGLTRDEYKLSYLSSLIDFYQRYVDFLVDRGQPDRAAEVAESSRARLLDERLSASRQSPAQSSVAAFQRIAQSSHAVVLSYWLAPERSFLWAITPDSITLHILPPEKQIAPLVESYRTFIEALRDPLDSEFADARKLSQILLGPVQPLLRDGVRLIVVPDRVLNSLNFETLPDPADPSHYLIDRATLEVAPSLSVLAAPRSGVNHAGRMLLIGDAEPAVEEFPKLPYASKEMELIAANFAPDRYTRLAGAQAIPAAYRASAPGQFAWIHFAAHASANRENPLDSALILSRGDGGYALSAREVMEIPLNADLVTLSACRGAGAKTYSGEGLVGLSWAFLRAGAKNVVAGLWDVTDLSTASLMADFYAGMTRGAAPADALRAAKLRLIRSNSAYRKPFYWGPFQLYAGTTAPTG